MKKISIGPHKIERGSTPLLIAEIGNNHNGCLKKAKELIDISIDSGAHIVKFQMRNISELYREAKLCDEQEDLNVEYTIDLLKKYELSKEDHFELFNYCKEKGITYLCTPWDLKSVEILEEFGVLAYKISSADLTNIDLIEKVISTKKPIIISTGMSSQKEIDEITKHLKKNFVEYIILHCNSTYPAPEHSINLKFINTLKKEHEFVGYSGHERGISISMAAATLGAIVIERHITLDKDMEGPDHMASLLPDEFLELSKGIEQIISALGVDKKIISQGEIINRENLAKSLVAKRDIQVGHIISEEDIIVKSPGRGLSPLKKSLLLGQKAKRSIKKHSFFYESDISNNDHKRVFNFSRPWGIPVRFHDYHDMTKGSNMDLVEFHLSYKDLELDIEQYFSNKQDLDFIVHAPELFEGSHLLDLATKDKDYRKLSIKNMEKVISLTLKLKKFFPKTKRPMIVTNIGGFSANENTSKEETRDNYQRFLESLKELDLSQVEIIPQTMAPYPWHFGGQRYQNLFVHPQEIIDICSQNNLRICLDISHTFLTANTFDYDFYQIVRDLAPHVAHLHLADAKGLDGEGLQFGEGEINLEKFSHALKETTKNDVSFIPEIWQGHKDSGAGFWRSLDTLEQNL